MQQGIQNAQPLIRDVVMPPFPNVGPPRDPGVFHPITFLHHGSIERLPGRMGISRNRDVEPT